MRIPETSIYRSAGLLNDIHSSTVSTSSITSYSDSSKFIVIPKIKKIYIKFIKKFLFKFCVANMLLKYYLTIV